MAELDAAAVRVKAAIDITTSPENKIKFQQLRNSIMRHRRALLKLMFDYDDALACVGTTSWYSQWKAKGRPGAKETPSYKKKLVKVDKRFKANRTVSKSVS
ncbi:MAG: hypothetical protein JEZ11_03900 [Desulfobacterales bacterium]|nr:hypothetical protein [Desulfobacterales bacterium]